ncbi:DUF1653 domain-containing protein [Candidatus Shapirobacteria bacterium]|nr:DUF1653 domain-containing protein [Candidatus Shapirobacteria bacterium]
MKEIKPGTYRHYKGTLVVVIGIALHSETLEEMVVYNHPDPIKGKGANTMWVRPKKMFMENVRIDGKKVPRFEFIKKAEDVAKVKRKIIF